MLSKKFRQIAGLAWLVFTVGLLLTACADDALTNPPVKPAVLAAFQTEPKNIQGDPVNGEKVFNRLPCLSCHNLDGAGQNNGTAPGLDHIGTTAATRLSGVNASQYLHHAVTNPQDLSLPDYHKIMPSFSSSASPQEINDLVSFLLSLK